MHLAFGVNSTIIDRIVVNQNKNIDTNEFSCSSNPRIGKLCLSNEESSRKNPTNMQSLVDRIQTEKNSNIRFKPPTSKDFLLSDLK